MKTKKEYGYDLMLWYEQNKRALPWRKYKNAYYTWISEIMLQQTRVEAVIPYYERFIKKLPTIEALANCDDEVLRKLWQGLGYYRRCEYMKQAAIQVVNEYQGILPKEYESLKKLKGIGDYSAAAIASIAYDQNQIAVDGNVLRVFTRILNSDLDITKSQSKQIIKQEVAKYVENNYGIFNQALMELGATICIPNGKAKCEQCVFQTCCLGFQNQNYEQYPKKTVKKARKQQAICVIIMECDGEILIHKRDEKGLLANLYEFITIEKHMLKTQVIKQYETSKIHMIKPLKPQKHLFTHVEWDMQGYYLKVETKIAGLWVKKTELQKYPFPSAFLKYLLDIS